MNEEMMAQLQAAGQGGAPAGPGGGMAAQNAQMLQEIGQIVSENNAMIKEIGQMIAQAMGGGGEAEPMDEEEALRQEAMARLQQQG